MHIFSSIYIIIENNILKYLLYTNVYFIIRNLFPRSRGALFALFDERISLEIRKRKVVNKLIKYKKLI